MQKIIKHHFSLIEVLISTGIFSILLFYTTTLFFRYHKLQIEIQKNKPYILEKSLFHTKMIEITGTIIHSSIQKNQKNTHRSFDFIFDNGYKEEPEFSGKIKGSIYKNLEDQIVLKITSNQGKYKKYPLLSQINSFEYSLNKNILNIQLIQKQGLTQSYTFFLSKQESAS